jgi:hypothetical protein
VGANGEPALDAIYTGVIASLREHAPGIAVGVYRHLTGDFAVASALGLELAVRAVSAPALPDEVDVVAGPASGPTAHVLLYHLTSSGMHSVMIVSA